MKVDVNRGVLIKRHGPTGMHIYMYHDTPGDYFDAHGHTIPAKLAKDAGFDTARHLRLKERASRLARANAAIDEELSLMGESGEEVIEEAKGFKVVRLPLGNAMVYDEEGNQILNEPIAEAQAKLIFRHMIGEEVEDEEPVEPEPKPNPNAKAKAEKPKPRATPEPKEETD